MVAISYVAGFMLLLFLWKESRRMQGSMEWIILPPYATVSRERTRDLTTF